MRPPGSVLAAFVRPLPRWTGTARRSSPSQIAEGSAAIISSCFFVPQEPCWPRASWRAAINILNTRRAVQFHLRSFELFEFALARTAKRNGIDWNSSKVTTIRCAPRTRVVWAAKKRDLRHRAGFLVTHAVLLQHFIYFDRSFHRSYTVRVSEPPIARSEAGDGPISQNG